MIKNIEGVLEEIDFDIGVKYFPLFHTVFGIYINILEHCMEDVGCVSTTLAREVTCNEPQISLN